MPKVTNDCRALEADDLAWLTEPAVEVADREPWICMQYDRRDDAFAAAEAADLLGVSWRLLPRWSVTDEIEHQEWVIEILLDHTLPLAANGSICRDVE